jgi:hypothetical protein
MQQTPDDILGIVLDAVREYNRQEGEVRIVPSPDTALLGGGSQFDSVAAVVLASIVEERIERRFNQTVSVLDVFGAAGTDFLDIGMLAERIARKMSRQVA